MSILFHLKQALLLPRYRPAYIFAALWMLTMILLPILLWTVGDSILPAGIYLSAILQAAAVFVMIRAEWGFSYALRVFMLVGVLTWAAEWLGQQTGFPFGDYAYTSILQPQLGGVPLLIPVAWFMLLPAAWSLAGTITGPVNTLRQRLVFALLSAGALTAWDLFLDPQMVAWNFWVWDQPSGYYGIPWSNYAGWLLVSALVTLLINPRHLPFLPLALIYAGVWFLQTIGQALFWGQPGPALFGFLGMGIFLLAAGIRWRKQIS